MIWLFTLLACGSPDCLLVRVDGADLPVCVEGDLDSPELLLHLAGGPSAVGGWVYTNNGLRPELLERFAVARYDYRSFGASKGTYDLSRITMAQLGHDTNEVIRALQIRYPDKEIWIHGHSFGGALGTATLLDPDAQPDGWISEAGCHDSRLAGETSKQRILDHDTSDLGPEQATRWDEIRIEIADLDATDPVESAQINGFANEVEDFYYFEGPDNSLQGTLPFAVGMPFQLLQVGFPASVANGTLSGERTELDYATRIAEVEVPALFLTGELDFICTTELNQDAFETIGSDRKEIEVFEGTTHDFGDQSPFEVVEVIEAFIRPG